MNAPKSPRTTDVALLRHGPTTGTATASSPTIFDAEAMSAPVRRFLSQTMEQPPLFRPTAQEHVDRSRLDRSPRTATPPITFGPTRSKSPRQSPLGGMFPNAAHVPLPRSSTNSPGDPTSTRPALPNGSVGLASPSLSQPFMPRAPIFTAITDAAMPTTPASNPGAEASTPIPALVVSARQAVADYLDRASRIAVDVEQTRSPSSGPPIVGGYDSREEFEAEAAMYRAVRTRLVECGESCAEM